MRWRKQSAGQWRCDDGATAQRFGGVRAVHGWYLVRKYKHKGELYGPYASLHDLRNDYARMLCAQKASK